MSYKRAFLPTPYFIIPRCLIYLTDLKGELGNVPYASVCKRFRDIDTNFDSHP